MKRRKGRLQHSDMPREALLQRQEVRAVREAFYAQRRGDTAQIAPEPIELREEPVVRATVMAVPVPTDWRDLHWKKRVAIAKQCYPGFQFVNGADADEAIACYLGVEP